MANWVSESFTIRANQIKKVPVRDPKAPIVLKSSAAPASVVSTLDGTNVGLTLTPALLATYEPAAGQAWGDLLEITAPGSDIDVTILQLK